MSPLRRVLDLLTLAWQTSLYATVRFNLHYFPLGTALRVPVLIHRGTRLRRLRGSIELSVPARRGMVVIGYRITDIFDERQCRAVWDNFGGRVTIGGEVSIAPGCQISVGPNGHLTLGDGFRTNQGVTIICRYKISFGDGCIVSWKCSIMDTDFHPIRDKDGKIINYNQPVIIGDHVWIGANSQVLKGSIIPEGTIVAAGSTVAGKISGSHSIIGGVPARVLRSDIYWSLGMVPPPPDGGGGA